MSASVRVGDHIRRNAVAYISLFVALSGTSYAASKITTGDIKKNAITSKLVKDGQIATADLADLAVTQQKLAAGAVSEQKLAFDAATQAELNAFLADLAAGGTINNPSNPVSFTKLKNVPAGFADGSDDTGGAPGNNSLGAAEPAATDDEIVDGSIDAEDIADGTIANADVSPTAAIDDSKLGAINDPGKVADAALSNNVALLNTNQTFTAPKSFNSSVFFNLDDPEFFELDSTQTGTGFGGLFGAGLTNNTSADTQEVGVFSNANGSTGVTERLLRLTNFDNQAVGAGILFDPAGQAITTGIDASAANVGTALNVGANDIQTDTATISSAELNTLDGNVANPSRSVSLPLGSFVNVTDETTLNFTPSDGISPDLALLGDSLVIEWDDNSSGVADTDFVASNFSVPIDHASGGGITVVSSKDGDTGVDERLRCETSVNGAAALSALTTTFMSTSQTIHSGGMGSPVAAGDRVTVRCAIDDGAGGSTANDVVRIREVRFGYQSDQ